MRPCKTCVGERLPPRRLRDKRYEAAYNVKLKTAVGDSLGPTANPQLHCPASQLARLPDRSPGEA